MSILFKNQNNLFEPLCLSPEIAFEIFTHCTKLERIKLGSFCTNTVLQVRKLTKEFK